MVGKEKEIIIYPKRSFGKNAKKYLTDLNINYSLGYITNFTYKRVINQYYSNCI